MRKIIVLSMLSLDGVMQAPGGPEEDKSGGFEFGGWTAPFSDEAETSVIKKELAVKADYILGRKTFEIWEAYWPHHNDYWPNINSGKKFVLSMTRKESNWENSYFIETLDDIIRLKNSDGPDLHVWGSSELVQLLLENDLVDELRLKIYPVLLGKGKKLFDHNAMPSAFKLTESIITPKGIVIAAYIKDGTVRTGSAGE